ncbi:MAG: hypothetical protein MUE42_06595 [Opitutaceae bacterium]|jgi:hypothetical protein|nr:hypothetical protein [Opitutaceae bacterium]
MRNVTPPPPRAPRKFPAALAWTGVAALVVVLCVLFPRVLAFVELAARELRYFWWLILLVVLAGYFFFFFGRKKP